MHKVDSVNIGDVFGRLTVVAGPVVVEDANPSHKDGECRRKRRRKRYVCKCACGCIRTFDVYQLLTGDVKSCGCLKKEYYASLHRHNTDPGDYATALYGIWQGMIRRCHSTSAPNYCFYGARGIRVCDLWRQDFGAFKAWSHSHGYKRGLQIDRIDVNGDYHPYNCRWATPRQNARNRRKHAEIVYRGVKRRIVDLIEESGSALDAQTVWKRIQLHGWDVERALSEPKHTPGKSGALKIKFQGRIVSTEWLAQLSGLSRGTIRRRIMQEGMSAEEAIAEPRKTHKNRDCRMR